MENCSNLADFGELASIGIFVKKNYFLDKYAWSKSLNQIRPFYTFVIKISDTNIHKITGPVKYTVDNNGILVKMPGYTHNNKKLVI